MLQKLNERIQGLITWVIVGVITVTFTLFGLSYYLQSRQASDVRVHVNDQKITQQAFELNYRRLSQMQNANTLTKIGEKALKQQVLSEMIMNAVSVGGAHSSGFEVHDAQATAAILLIPQFQEDGHFSASRYTQALNNAFYTPQTFQQEVRQGMLLNQQRFALIGTAFILPNELKQFVRLSMQTRDYTYTRLKADDFNQRVSLTEDEIQQYYNSHKTQFYTKEAVSVDYIQLSLQDIRDQIKVAPEMIARYYEDNKTDYLTPAQWQLAYIRFPLEEQASEQVQKKVKRQADRLYETLTAQPQQFDQLGKKAAADHHAEYGNAPVMIAGRSSLDKQLVNLTRPGQISEPIRTAAGYELFKVVSYQPAATQPFEQVKPLIAQQLLQENAQKQFTEIAERLSELAYQNPDSLTYIADTLKMNIHHSELFSRQGGSDPLTRNNLFVQAAFSPDVLSEGNNSEPIQIDMDNMVVLRAKQHFPAVLQSLEQVKKLVVADLTHQKAVQAARFYGQQWIAHPESDSMLQRWDTVKDVMRDSDSIDTRVNELAFSIAQTDQYGGVTLENGDFAVVHVLKIADGKMDVLDKEQQANVTQQMEASYGLMDYDLYIDRLMNQAKIIKP